MCIVYECHFYLSNHREEIIYYQYSEDIRQAQDIFWFWCETQPSGWTLRKNRPGGCIDQ